jgi:LPXTG-motif cell wall-anchored protein
MRQNEVRSRSLWGYPMTRRFTVAVAILAFCAVALLPGIASAQAGSPPPVVAGTVVENPAPVVSGESLPRTGTDVIPMAIGAVALLVVGGMLVIATRRRQGNGVTPA